MPNHKKRKRLEQTLKDIIEFYNNLTSLGVKFRPHDETVLLMCQAALNPTIQKNITKTEKAIDLLTNNADIRLVDENNDQLGIMKYSEAVEIASERDLFLEVVAEHAGPPVLKLYKL